MPVVTEEETKAGLRAPIKYEESQLGFLQEVIFVRRSWPAGYSPHAVSQRSPSPARGVPLKTEVGRENEGPWVNPSFALSKTFQVSSKHCMDMLPPSSVSNCANASTTPLQDFMILWNFVYNEETLLLKAQTARESGLFRSSTFFFLKTLHLWYVWFQCYRFLDTEFPCLRGLLHSPPFCLSTATFSSFCVSRRLWTVG